MYSIIKKKKILDLVQLIAYGIFQYFELFGNYLLDEE